MAAAIASAGATPAPPRTQKPCTIQIHAHHLHQSRAWFFLLSPNDPSHVATFHPKSEDTHSSHPCHRSHHDLLARHRPPRRWQQFILPGNPASSSVDAHVAPFFGLSSKYLVATAPQKRDSCSIGTFQTFGSQQLFGFVGLRVYRVS